MLIIGVLVSVLWLSGLGYVVYLNLDKAVALELNAWGDFLAGGFAPLAFFWLVIGYFQQGKELRLSRDALILQAEELKNSVEQQRELVQATYEDIAFAKAESITLREHNKKMAQPIFKLNGGECIFYKDGRAAFVFDVLNYGCDIKSVDVTVCDGGVCDALEDEHDYDWVKWGRDEKKMLWAGCKKEDVSGLEWVAFNVICLDGLGDKAIKQLGFIIRDGRVLGLDISDVEFG